MSDTNLPNEVISQEAGRPEHNGSKSVTPPNDGISMRGCPRELGPKDIIKAYIEMKNIYVEFNLLDLIRQLNMCISKEEFDILFNEAEENYRGEHEDRGSEG